MTSQHSIVPYDTNVPARHKLVDEFVDPTKQVSGELSLASNHFNKHLFDNKLRPCLVTLQRHRGYGYFAAQRYVTRDGTQIVDEIALNPDLFHKRSVTEIFSTLVHEQVHALQFQYGRPSPNGYHNKEWGDWMERIGLIPSSTGAPGGQRTGIRMSHWISPEGPFAQGCAELLATTSISFIDLWALATDATAREPRAGRPTDVRHLRRLKSKVASKTRFSCPECKVNAWGNPNLRIDCRPCRQPMAAH
jgi:predicted SprT family Zn-dependent metalloprotease